MGSSSTGRYVSMCKSWAFQEIQEKSIKFTLYSPIESPAMPYLVVLMPLMALFLFCEGQLK